MRRRSLLKNKPYDCELTYIESTGEQYIDTLISGGSNAEYEIEFSMLEQTVDYPQICCSVWNGQGQIGAPKIYAEKDKRVYAERSNGSSYALFVYNTSTRYRIEYKNGKIYSNQSSTQYDVGTYGFGNGTFSIFASKYELIYKAKMRLYSCKLWLDGNIVRDFIPVSKDGVGYLYDKVSKQLFGNQGTGEFVLGNCTHNGHEYVEIGGMKWATMNIGANSITDYGLYFQWGDTQGYTAAQVGSGEGQKYFGWADYKYGNGTSSSGATAMTKYNASDGKTVLEASDDAARVNWGGNWRMPTNEECVSLGNATTSAWTTSYQSSGVKGLVLTSKENSTKKLFFPGGGFLREGSLQGGGGDYLSSSLYTSEVQKSYIFNFWNSKVNWGAYTIRVEGRLVRGVLD